MPRLCPLGPVPRVLATSPNPAWHPKPPSHWPPIPPTRPQTVPRAAPDPRRILAVVPSIRIEGTTARIRRGSGEVPMYLPSFHRRFGSRNSGSRASTSASDCWPDRALASGGFFGDWRCRWGCLLDSNHTKKQFSFCLVGRARHSVRAGPGAPANERRARSDAPHPTNHPRTENSCKQKESLVRRRKESYNRCGSVRRKPEHKVEYYAHTAVRPDGTPDRDTAKWQLLSTHSRNVGL